MQKRLFLASLFFIFGCQRSDPVTRAILDRYQVDADGFCNAMVDCLKDEVKAKLQASPERRDMVLSRMTRDFCRKNQYSVIGRLSTDASGGAATERSDLYNWYHECSEAVQKAPDCVQRRKIHSENPSCVKIRTESGY